MRFIYQRSSRMALTGLYLIPVIICVSAMAGERSVHDIIYLQLIPEFPKSPPDTDKPGGKSSAPDANPPLNAAKKHEALDGESMKTRQIF